MILAISGSLRRNSVNSAALRAAASSGGTGRDCRHDRRRAEALPHFDPDLELAPPELVVRFRAACESAAGVLLAVPEYAFGIPGAFKNALDWTVAQGSLYRKPVAVLDVAPPGRGARVREALDHVLTALDADVTHFSVPITEPTATRTGRSVTPIVIDSRTVVAELAQRAGLGRAA